MSETKNSGLDQYGAEPFEQQQSGTAGVEEVNNGTDDMHDMLQTNLAILVSF